MADNDFLKPCFETPKFSGRYLVFVFEKDSIGGGQNDTIGSYDTLSEIEIMFKIKPDGPRPLRFASNNTNSTDGYDFIEILDMDERRIIDLNELNFQPV